MSEALFALGDLGATQTRIAILDRVGFTHSVTYTETNPDDYEGSVQKIADHAEEESEGKGRIIAASIAVAAEINAEGVLTKAGGLSKWLGNNLGADLAVAFDLPEERVGTVNDMVAVAISQRHVNSENRRPADGYVVTVSSGLGGAWHAADGETINVEPGHEHLRPGAKCPCGEDGHVEAFVSGKGVVENHGVSMREWLGEPRNATELVTDLSTAMVELIERYKTRSGFTPDEFRWTGGVAIGQPFIIERVETIIRNHMGIRTPSFDTVTRGDQAGLHGTFIDARNRAMAA